MRDLETVRKTALAAIENSKDSIIETGRWIWNNPESGYREVKTSAYIVNELRKLGLEVKTGLAMTGFRADIDTGKPGPTVAIMGVADLEKEIENLEATLKSARKLQKVLVDEMNAVVKKYGQPRKTEILYTAAEEAEESEEEEQVPETPVHLFVSKQGYLKKITPQSLRMSGEQKFKEGDSLSFTTETTSRAEILVFTDKFQCYKSRLSEFDDSKASLLGDYLPQKLGMEPGENVVSVVLPGDYSGFVLFFFENGKAAKVPLSAYETKTNRKKLTGAYSDKSPLRTVLSMKEDAQLVAYSTDGRAMIFSTALLLPKTTRNTQGVSVLTLRKKAALDFAAPLAGSNIKNESRYRAKAIPAAGAVLKAEEAPQQQITLEL